MYIIPDVEAKRHEKLPGKLPTSRFAGDIGQGLFWGMFFEGEPEEAAIMKQLLPLSRQPLLERIQNILEERRLRSIEREHRRHFRQAHEKTLYQRDMKVLLPKLTSPRQVRGLWEEVAYNEGNPYRSFTHNRARVLKTIVRHNDVWDRRLMEQVVEAFDDSDSFKLIPSQNEKCWNYVPVLASNDHMTADSAVLLMDVLWGYLQENLPDVKTLDDWPPQYTRTIQALRHLSNSELCPPKHPLLDWCQQTLSWLEEKNFQHFRQKAPSIHEWPLMRGELRDLRHLAFVHDLLDISAVRQRVHAIEELLPDIYEKQQGPPVPPPGQRSARTQHRVDLEVVLDRYLAWVTIEAPPATRVQWWRKLSNLNSTRALHFIKEHTVQHFPGLQKEDLQPYLTQQQDQQVRRQALRAVSQIRQEGTREMVSRGSPPSPPVPRSR